MNDLNNQKMFQNTSEDNLNSPDIQPDPDKDQLLGNNNSSISDNSNGDSPILNVNSSKPPNQEFINEQVTNKNNIKDSIQFNFKKISLILGALFVIISLGLVVFVTYKNYLTEKSKEVFFGDIPGSGSECFDNPIIYKPSPYKYYEGDTNSPNDDDWIAWPVKESCANVAKLTDIFGPLDETSPGSNIYVTRLNQEYVKGITFNHIESIEGYDTSQILNAEYDITEAQLNDLHLTNKDTQDIINCDENSRQVVIDLTGNDPSGRKLIKPNGWTAKKGYWQVDITPKYSCSVTNQQSLGAAFIRVVPRSNSGLICYQGIATPEHPEYGDISAITEWTIDYQNRTATAKAILSKNFVDNTYGANTIGWTKTGHNFGDLVESDLLNMKLVDDTGKTVMDFNLDYISIDNSAPSGYRNLGVRGGEGSMITGNADYILSTMTSIDQNLNEYAYILLKDSPITNENYSPNPQYPKWIFDAWYSVTFSLDAFPPTMFDHPVLVGLHASPNKFRDKNAGSLEPGECNAVTCNSPCDSTHVCNEYHTCVPNSDNPNIGTCILDTCKNNPLLCNGNCRVIMDCGSYPCLEDADCATGNSCKLFQDNYTCIANNCLDANGNYSNSLCPNNACINPIVTPTPEITPTPSQLTCSSLITYKATPAPGDTLTYTCTGSGSTAGYANFRIMYKDSVVANSSFEALENGLASWEYLIPENAEMGQYLVQCRICTDSTQTTQCTEWGQANISQTE